MYVIEGHAGSAGVERKRLFLNRKSVRDLAARHHLAHVQGSDSHCMDAFEHQDQNKPWTRMKLLLVDEFVETLRPGNVLRTFGRSGTPRA